MKILVILKRVTFFLAAVPAFSCMAEPSPYFSGTPPSVVYRVDTRAPQEIFQFGFQAWGNDYNLIRHIAGATCSTDGSTSGFISTASNNDAAMGIAARHLEERGIAYIYSIRADSNFYNAAESVQWIQNRYNTGHLAPTTTEMARRAGEWDAIDYIPPRNIIEVSILRPDTPTTTEYNPGYEQLGTSGNERLYTDNAITTVQYYGFDVSYGGFSGRLSSCFASCFGADSPGDRDRRSVGVCSDQPERVRWYDPERDL